MRRQGLISTWYEGEKFFAQIAVAQESASHYRVNHFAVGVFYAAPCHAVVGGLHDECQPVGVGFFLYQVGELHNGFFLNLWPSHNPFGQACVFREPNYIGAFVGHYAYPQFAHDGAEMV